MTKKTASHLAKAIIELGRAEFGETDVRNIRKFSAVNRKLSRLFNKSGYEFGDGDGSRIRLRKA